MQLRGYKLALLDDVKARIDEAKKRIQTLKAAEKGVLDLIQNLFQKNLGLQL